MEGQTGDQCCVEQLFNLLPDWMKSVVTTEIKNKRWSLDKHGQSQSLVHSYAGALNKEVVIEPSIHDDALDISASDVIVRTCSTNLHHGISFTTCTAGAVGDGDGRRNSEKLCCRIAVPHLARLPMLQHQWSTLPIPGRILCMVYMLVSYSNSKCGYKDPALDYKSGTLTEIDDDGDRPSAVDRER